MSHAELSRDMGIDKRNQKDRIPIAASGLMVALLGYIGNAFEKVLDFHNPLLTNTIIGAGVAIAIYGFTSELKKPEEQLFINCGLNIGNMYPKIIRKQKVDENITNYIISMPKGLGVSDFKARKEMIEQGLNGSVEFTFNKMLVMKVNKAQLLSEYIFEPIVLKDLQIALGHNKFKLQILDLGSAPHVIIAGCPGAGKSISLRNIATQIITTKPLVELYMYDAQKVELGLFKNAKMVKGFYSAPSELMNLLLRLDIESKRRVELMEHYQVTSIAEYNRRYPNEAISPIVVMFDEFAMLHKETEIMEQIKKRVAVDRKCSIHFILATQRPSKEIIDPVIKACVPCRISFKTSSDQDSEIVLDQRGAEKLKGKGHGLMRSHKPELDEFQGFNLSESLCAKYIKPFTEVKKIAEKESEPDTSGKI